jgi:hypothetical protein
MLCFLPASFWFLAWLILRPWRRKWHVPLKHWLTFNGLHDLIFHKKEILKLFITIVVKTLNPSPIYDFPQLMFSN